MITRQFFVNVFNNELLNKIRWNCNFFGNTWFLSQSKYLIYKYLFVMLLEEGSPMISEAR